MTTSDITATWERFVRFHRAATTEMDARLRADFGRTLDDYDVLHQIRSHGAPIRMGDLAQQLVVANSSCHRIVGRLVDEGLLERSSGAGDRREVRVGLTPRGTRQWRRMAAAHTRDITRLVGAPLSQDERAQLHRILGRLLGDRVTDGGRSGDHRS